LREQLAAGAPLGEVLGVFLYSVSKRLDALLRVEADFAYFELLYLSHGLLVLAGHGAGFGEAALAGELRAALDEYLRPYPRLAGLMSTDLESLGHNPVDAGVRTGSCDNLIATIGAMFSPALLRRQEDESLAAIAADSTETDFSFYLA